MWPSDTGTRTESFPFLPSTGRERISATFSGACPTTVQLVLTFNPNDLTGNTLTGNATATATPCNGDVTWGLNMARQ